MKSSSALSLVSLAVCLGSGMALAGPAVNQFEVKDLDVEQGEVEIEVQSDFASGFPRRKFFQEEGGDEVEFDDNEVARQRHELAIGFGLTNWLKIGTGVEFEEERVDDPPGFSEAHDFTSLKATEIGFEGIAVLVPVEKNGVGLGLFAELQLPMSGEARTLYAGPIVQAASGPWSATGNFAFVKFMGGAREEGEEEGELLPRDDKWDFAYFTQLRYEASESLALTLEAYGTIDRIGDSGNASEAAREIGDQDQHRIGPAAYYTFKRREMPNGRDDDDKSGIDAQSGDDDDDEGGSLTVGAGVLFGLNDNTPDTTVKTSVEVEF